MEKDSLSRTVFFFLAGGASFTSNYSAEARKEDTLRHSVDHYTSAQGLHLEFTICKLELY